MKWPRLRFSVRTLLIAATAVALFFGAARIHHRKVLRTVEEYEAEGATLEIPNELIDDFWQRKPTRGVVTVENLPAGGTKIGKHTFGADENSHSWSHFNELMDELTTQGVEISVTVKQAERLTINRP